MWAGIGLLRRSVIAGITLLCLMLSLLIVVNAGGTTNTEASLETVGRVKTSKNDAATSGSSEKTASDGDSSSVNGQSQPGDEGSQPGAPSGATSNSPSVTTPGQASSGQQQSVPGSPGTFPPTTRPPTTSPPTTIACPTNEPSASGAITSFWQPPYNPNLPSSSQVYNVSGSVVVTNTGNRPVDVDLTAYLVSPLNTFGWQLYLGSMTVGPNSSSSVGFSDERVYANSSSDIRVVITEIYFSFQC
jgi:hypothetical protein